MSDGRANRRRFLAAIAGLSAAGVSGCGSDGAGTDTPDVGDETPTATATSTATPESTPDEGDETPTATPADTAMAEATDTPADTATATPTAADLAEWPTYMYNNQNWGDHPDATGPREGVSVAWRRALDAAQVNATAVLADGTLYVGDGRPTDDKGTLYALDPLTGETDWRIDLSGPVLGGAAVDDQGRVYIAAGTDFLALTGEGDEVWSFQGGTDLDFAAATVTEDYLYLGGDSGRLFKLDKLSSTRDWTYLSAGTIPSAPIPHDGTVYVPSRDDSVYAINIESGNEEWVADRGSPINGLSMRDGQLFAAVEKGRVVKLDTRGRVRWSEPVGGAAATTPAVTDRMVYVGTREDAFVALDRGDGIEQWRFDDTDSPFTAPPVVVEGTVYAGCHDSRVYALDAGTGDVRWSYATGNNIVDPAPVVSGNTVFIGSRDGNFYALSG